MKLCKFALFLAFITLLSVTGSFASMEVAGVINASWYPPVGIPRPDFGITNSRWLYHPDFGSKTFDYGSGAVAYRTNEYGPYSHFINKYHPSATDTANTYGTPSTPRLTIPYSLPAGSCIQVCGSSNGPGNGYSFNNTGPGNNADFSGPGTASDPIFIYGISTNESEMAWFGSGSTYELNFMGNYMIVENLGFTNITGGGRASLKGSGIDHVTIRDCVNRGNGTTSSDGSFSFPGSSSSDVFCANDILFFRILSSGSGDWQASVANDNQLFIMSQFSTNCWVLECVIYNNGGDAGRFGKNTESSAVTADCKNHFMGRCVVYDNLENAIDVKKSANVVISENVFHGFYGKVSAADGTGSAIVIHYYPTNVAIINNIVYDSGRGIGFVSQGPTNFVIGNIVYNCIITNSTGGIGLYEDRGGGTFFNYNNTIYNCAGGGILCTSGGGVDAIHDRNNIIMNMASGTSYIEVDAPGTRSSSTFNNDLIYNSSGSIRILWSSTYTSVASWISGTTVGDGSIEQDPLFKNTAIADFNLTSSSPARNAGVSLSDLEAAFLSSYGWALNYKDLNGNTPDGTPDMGALQYFNPARIRFTGRIGFNN